MALTVGVMELLIALAGGGAVGAIITAWSNRRKAHAEISDITLNNALELEQRAMERYDNAMALYTGAMESLDVASAALAAAKQQLRTQKAQLDVFHSYTQTLQDLLKRHGIVYPHMPPLPTHASRVETVVHVEHPLKESDGHGDVR